MSPSDRVLNLVRHVFPSGPVQASVGLASCSASSSDEHAFGVSTPAPPKLRFMNRRSPALARKAMVACSQPAAAEAGLQILKAGGNAVDAAIAIAAALGVTEPMMTGVGGDSFMLYWDQKSRKVHALNGSGRAPADLTAERAKAEGGSPWLFSTHAHTVTVPGTVAAWEAALEHWGTKSLGEVLKPAITLAEEGFPVSQIAALHWEGGAEVLKKTADCSELLVDGKRAPSWGEVFYNPGLAAVLREIAEHGSRAGFYEGWPGQKIIAALKSRGSCMSEQDLAAHQVDFPEPISTHFMGVDVFMHPPNGSGIVTLLALQILKGLGVEKCAHNSADYTHQVIEALRLAFIDGRRYNGDPQAMAQAHMDGKAPSMEELLSDHHAEAQRTLIDPQHATVNVHLGSALPASDTVSFQVVDEQGNSVSMVESLWMAFGSGIVPEGCGFALQNRGANFQLSAGPNQLQGGKRPYHTIIPGMCLRNGDFYCSFTNMGGMVQPQGHVQNLMNILAFGMDPQRSVDQPRFCIATPLIREMAGRIYLQEGFDEAVVAQLKKMGHDVKVVSGNAMASVFGKAQIILRSPKTGVLWGGSDGRGDGLAFGY